MPITDKQLERRQRHIGSSDIAAILGVDPYRNAHDVYLEKLGIVEPFEGNDATEWGNRFEPMLLDWAANELDVSIRKNQRRVNGIFAANLDAVILDFDGALEAKSSRVQSPTMTDEETRAMWGEPGTDEVPEYVLAQVHHQMLCADLRVVFVPAFLGWRGPAIFRVDRNDDIIAAIKTEGERFWREHVEARVAPPDITPSLDVLKRVRREPESRTDVDEALVLAYEQASEAYKEAKKARDEAQAELIAALGEHEGGQSPHFQVSYLEQSRTGVDTKALKRDHPDLFDSYKRTSTYRVLRTRKESE